MAEQYSIVKIYYILFIHLFMNMWVFSTLGLLWIMLPWVFVYKFLCGCMFSFLSDSYWGGYIFYFQPISVFEANTCLL